MDVSRTSRNSADLYDRLLHVLASGRERVALWGADVIGIELLSLVSQSNLLGVIHFLLDERAAEASPRTFGLRVTSVDQLDPSSVDVLVITSDGDKEKRLRKLAAIFDGRSKSEHPVVLFSGTDHYEFRDSDFDEIVRSCVVKSKAGGYPAMLVHLYQCLCSIARREVQGDVAEFGVFQGGTTVFLAKCLARLKHNAKVLGFDTFTGFPKPRSLLDLYGDAKCEFHDFDVVRLNCSPYNIELIRGDIADTHVRLRDVELSLSFFDTDNYTAVRRALPLCAERTTVGGFIAFDHYYSPQWTQTIGERLAAKEVLDSPSWFNLQGTGVFVRVA